MSTTTVFPGNNADIADVVTEHGPITLRLSMAAGKVSLIAGMKRGRFDRPVVTFNGWFTGVGPAALAQDF